MSGTNRLYLPAGGECLKVTQLAPKISLGGEKTRVIIATIRIP